MLSLIPAPDIDDVRGFLCGFVEVSGGEVLARESFVGESAVRKVSRERGDGGLDFFLSIGFSESIVNAPDGIDFAESVDFREGLIVAPDGVKLAFVVAELVGFRELFVVVLPAYYIY